MRKKSLNNLSSRRRTLLKIRHQHTINRQKQFFTFIKQPSSDNSLD
ncbi:MULTISPECIES: hypothetical protein [Shewanella]|nr:MULTISPECIES: hypothetical protein [Shewanella]MCL1040817.1 hypothetical protein [Shewanella marisflavi]